MGTRIDDAGPGLDKAMRDRLQRVIAVGRTTRSKGIAVELPAIEMRSAGGEFMLRFRWSSRMTERISYLASPFFEVTDDMGHRFEAYVMASWNDGTGLSCRVVFFPAIPDGARSLVVEISHVGVAPELMEPDDRQLVGPWRFEIQLRE